MMGMLFSRRVILGEIDYKTVPTILQFDIKEISTDSRLKFLIVV